MIATTILIKEIEYLPEEHMVEALEAVKEFFLKEAVYGK